MGITSRGTELAKRIAKEISKISGIEVHVDSIQIEKDAPLNSEITFSGELKDLKNKVVVVVDDVLNSAEP